MPYIKQDARNQIDVDQLLIDGGKAKDAGTLNFILTTVVVAYFNANGGRYQQINDVVGALEGAKLEFYRRMAAPYEDKKIEENGDVY